MAEPTTQQTLSVIIPVYWNESSIPFLGEKLVEFERSLQALDLALEVICIDDGSGDDSLKQLLELRKTRPGLKVIALSRNFGAVAASKAGLPFVTGDCFVIVAADLQDPLEQVFEMAKHWRAGHRLVISRRESRDDPLLTKAFSWLYYVMLRLLVVKDYPAGGFDLMLMDRLLLPYLAGSGKHTNPTIYAFWLGFQPVILSYHRVARAHGKSRWTFGKKLNFMIDSISGSFCTPGSRLAATRKCLSMPKSSRASSSEPKMLAAVRCSNCRPRSCMATMTSIPGDQTTPATVYSTSP